MSTRSASISRLTSTEQQMLTRAMSPLTPPEKRELLYFLDVAELPSGSTARVQAVMERILGNRVSAVAVVMDDWGITGEGFEELFAEAVDDSGAWRFARDLRLAVGTGA